MKATDTFQTAIQRHLEQRAAADAVFAERLKNPARNLNDCVQYILNQVQKSGCNGFADEEIYGMAAHYYDEENIDIGKSVDVRRVVVNHVPELTPEEIAEAKKKALDELVEQQRQLLKGKKPSPKPAVIVEQASLF